MLARRNLPIVSSWYRTPGGETFEVVAVDPHDDAIDIQYLDGTIEEWDRDAWDSMSPSVIAPPHGVLAEAYDCVDYEQAGYDELLDDDDLIVDDWSSNDDY